MSPNKGHNKAAGLNGPSVTELHLLSIQISKAIQWRAPKQSMESLAVQNSGL